MITEEVLLRNEATIIDRDEGAPNFISELLESKSPLAVWLTSDSFEMLRPVEYSALVMLVEVLTKSYIQSEDMRLDIIDMDQCSKIEDELYAYSHKYSRNPIGSRFLKQDIVKAQPEVIDYITEFIDDLQDDIEVEKVILELFWVSALTITILFEKQ